MRLKIYTMELTSIRIIGGEINTFLVTVDLHQGFILSLYLFALVIDDIPRHIQDEVRGVHYLQTALD